MLGGMCVHIQKVQTNQINFGTKVYIEQETKNLILKSNAKRKFISHINKLENNGNNDVFVLKHFDDNDIVPMTFLNGTVFEKRKNGILKTPYGSIDALDITTLNKKRDVIIHEYANILEMYKKAKYEYTRRHRINNLSYNNYLSSLTTIS